jgi:potassium/hydrogen antiporter
MVAEIRTLCSRGERCSAGALTDQMFRDSSATYTVPRTTPDAARRTCHSASRPAASWPHFRAIFASQRGKPLEAPASVEIAKHTLMSGGLILAVGTLTGLLAQKIKVPDVAVFLIVGMLIGPEIFGLIDIKADSALNQIILLFGASYVLFDGGASLRFDVLKQVWITVVILATAGVLVTAAITGVAAYFVFGVPSIIALLLGAAIASTDPATLVPIFQQIKIRDRVAQTVMSESAFNDATGAIVTFGVLAVAMGTGEFSLLSSVLDLLKQAIVGIVAGVILGYLAAMLIAHEKYAFLMEYAPVVTLVAVIGAYFAADGLQASGFMAVFVFGIVIGNKDSFGFKMEDGEQQKMEQYVATTSFIARLFIFILLGVQVDFHLMNQYALGGVIVIAIFMLVARPATVFLCALPDRRARWSVNEMLFMCWTRETGVIPAALAGLLLGMKAPGAAMIASVTLIAVLMTILIQAPTTKWLGARLGLLEEHRSS